MTSTDITWRWIGRLLWLVFILFAGYVYYVNHYLPRGPMLDTGDVVCDNDDQGPCGEGYLEDPSRLNISDFAKFTKRYGIGVMIVLVVAGIFVSQRPPGGYRNQ